MRVGKTIAATAALLFLLTWSTLRGMDCESRLTEKALRSLDSFAASESALRRDVLSAPTSAELTGALKHHLGSFLRIPSAILMQQPQSVELVH